MTTTKDDQQMDEMVSSSDSYDNDFDGYRDDGFFDQSVYYIVRARTWHWH